MDGWIDREMRRTIPGVSDLAIRMVRAVWLHLLEREAIAEYQERFPSPWRRVTVVLDARDAVETAAGDHPWGVAPKDKADALEFLQRMETGKARPTWTGSVQTTY